MPQTPNDLNRTLKYSTSPNAPLDWWYGPYNDLNSALTATATTTDPEFGDVYIQRYIGMTVGIYNATGGVDEYWFKNGIEDNDLIPKIPDIDAILGNIKVAKFDKNGGSGHMNSLLSDEEGYVKLPVCTFTNPNGLFQGWSTTSGGGSLYNEGDEVPLTQATKFFAIWSGMISYTVSWIDGVSPDLVYTITAMADNNPIGNGDSVAAGSAVVMICTTQHYVSEWNGLPDGAVVSGNTVTINNLNQNLNVSCNVVEFISIRFSSIQHGNYTVVYNNGTPDNVSGDGGSSLAPVGSTVVIQYIPSETGWNATGWNVNAVQGPNPTTTEGQNSVTFTMPSVSLVVSAIEDNQTQVVVDFNTRTSPSSDWESLGVSTVNGQSATFAQIKENAPSSVKYYYVPGYDLDGWCSDEALTTLITDNDNFTASLNATKVYAKLTPKQTYLVSVNINPNDNAGTVSGAHYYYEGEHVTLTASANPGYHFVEWLDSNNAQVSTSSSYSFTMPGNDVTYTVVFAADTPSTVNVIGLSGTKKYASTMQDRIDTGTITSSQYTCTLGQVNTIAIVRNNATNDIKGYSVLLPQGYKVNANSVHFYDSIGNEYDKTQYQVTYTHGLPSSSSDSTIIQTFTYNGTTLHGHFMSLDDNTPTTVKFIIENE